MIDSVKNFTHISTIRDFGDWWAARNNVQFYVSKNANGYDLHVIAPDKMSDLTFFVPPTWTCSNSGQAIQQSGNSVLVKNVTNGMTINFTAK